jgi:SH3-like domain-containing protein
MRRLSLFSAACLALSGLAITPMLGSGTATGSSAHAQAATKGPSGLPLPRFVSLKAKRVNLRIGPGRDYAVAWLYTRSGVPMEVIQEYDNWRPGARCRRHRGLGLPVPAVRRAHGDDRAWKKGEATDDFINMHREARSNADVIARLEPGVVVSVKACNGDWCEAEADGTSGWIVQSEIWGAYPGEAFK